MHEAYREFLFAFFGWSIMAGLCLGAIFAVYRLAVYGVKSSIARYRKAKRFKEFKSHFKPRIV
ncbi:hypothetical protein D3C87_650730 [compost metagenome]